MEFTAFDERQPEFLWLSHAPVLRARPGSLEKFSDIPLVMYVKQDVTGESGSRYVLEYTVIFTNEYGVYADRSPDGDVGPHDRYRIRYGLTTPDGHEEMQAEGHKWVAFKGPREGTHPILWVSTTNNMVADHGAEGVVRFAPAPQLGVARRHVARARDGRERLDVRRDVGRDGARAPPRSRAMAGSERSSIPAAM